MLYSITILKYSKKISIIKSRLHLLSFILETDKASITKSNTAKVNHFYKFTDEVLNN